MMKMLSNFLILVTLISVVTPQAAFAQGAVAPTVVAPPSASFCTMLDRVSEKINLQIQEKDTALLEFISGRDALLLERSKERAATMLGKRSEWDLRRGEEYRLLETKASTSVQVTAIKEFEAAIDAAVQKRRNVIDIATSEIEMVVMKEVDARKVLIDQARTSLFASVTKAVTKAKNDCVSEVSDQKAQADFVAALALARSNYKKAITTLENRKDVLNPLLKKHEQNITKAVEQFRVDTEQAKTVLLKALEDQ